MANNLETPSNFEKNVLNIVLFGETGVGKSTAINAIANYLSYDSLKDAENSELLTPIPIRFSLMDANFEEKTIKIGESDNEGSQIGASSTQNPKSYLIKVPEKDVVLRIIDTPGIGDTRGLQHDEINMEKILTVLGELDHVNAICVLLKPNNSRFTVLFDYCVKYLLSKLDKTIFANFVFIFTNARASFYTPGDTYLPLKSMLGKISNDIRFDKENTFCIDNESIRYLAGKLKGLEFSENVVKGYSDSWRKSSETIKRMIDYIKTLPSVSTTGTLSINEARMVILKLTNPIIEAMEKCEESKEILYAHQSKMLENQNSLEKLKKLLYVPTIQYEIVENTYETKSKNKKRYAKVTFTRRFPFISFSFGTEYEFKRKVVTEAIYEPVIHYDEVGNVRSMVDEKANLTTSMNKVNEELQASIKAYENEENTLLDAMVQFNVFLKENVFVAGVDVFKSELVNLIRKEEKINRFSKKMENYENLLTRYLDKVKDTKEVTPKQILNIKNELLIQKHFGDYLKYFFDFEADVADTTVS